LIVGFITSLLQDFDLYLESTDRPDFAADGVGLRQVKLNLRAEELYALAAEPACFQPYSCPPSDPSRSRIHRTAG